MSMRRLFKSKDDQLGARCAQMLLSVCIAVACVLLIMSHAHAENEDASRYPHLQNLAPRQQRPLAVRPVQARSAQEVRPPQEVGSPYFEPSGSEGYTPPSARSRPYTEPRSAPVRRAPVILADPVPVIKPKLNPSTFIAVMGDAMGEQLAQGLDETYGERTDVIILRKARADSGLVRTDFYDWSKSANELIATTPRLSFAVMLVGLNDRQQIRDGEVMIEPLSERWKELYTQRVKGLVKAFSSRNIPLIWASLPPIKNGELSADLLTLNTLYREAVGASGGVYVDLWEPFADQNNAFSMTGPDVSGKMVRLRLPDGIHFTPIGARKAAHFIQVELRRLMELRGPPLPIAISAVETVSPVSPVQPLVPVVVAPVPTQPVVAARVKPTIGATFALTRIDVASDGVLMPIQGREALEKRNKSNDFLPPPLEGRADDFRWPKP
jgi:uncharacterized protein